MKALFLMSACQRNPRRQRYWSAFLRYLHTPLNTYVRPIILTTRCSSSWLIRPVRTKVIFPRIAVFTTEIFRFVLCFQLVSRKYFSPFALKGGGRGNRPGCPSPTSVPASVHTQVHSIWRTLDIYLGFPQDSK